MYEERMAAERAKAAAAMPDRDDENGDIMMAQLDKPGNNSFGEVRGSRDAATNELVSPR
jgi:hypothetical protein